MQGTWEQRFAKILNIIDKHWIKPSLYHKVHSFNWVDDNGEKHTYTPDFYSPKLNKYFEVKGYWWGDDKKKMEKVLEQNNINIEIIQKKELEIYEKLGRQRSWSVRAGLKIQRCGFDSHLPTIRWLRNQIQT